MKPGKPLRRRTPLKASVKPCCGKSLCQCGKPPSLAPGKPMERKPIKPNPKRKRETFAKNYGSKEWVEAIHALPCDVCGAYGWTVAAHTETGGMGMKAGPETIAPLCGSRYGVKGCHERLDAYELEEERPRLRQAAKARYAAWKKNRRAEP